MTGRTPIPPRRGPGPRPLVASLVIHVLLIGAMWWTGIGRREPLPEFQVFRVDLVSLPPAAEGLPEVAIEVPQEAPPQPDPVPPPPPEPERTQPRETAPPERARPPEEQRAAEPPPETARQTGPRPDTTSRTGGEGLNVQIAGEAFAYPEYLQNIIRQVNRFFRWAGGQGLEAEVYFAIQRDGSVADIQMVRGSGDIAFNLEALAAVEQAGRRQAFGPLPEGFQSDRLDVTFSFRPVR